LVKLASGFGSSEKECAVSRDSRAVGPREMSFDVPMRQYTNDPIKAE